MYEYILPPAVLLLAFIFRLLIDRTATLPEFLDAFCGLTIDIVFLSISFVAGHILANPQNSSNAFVNFIVYVAIAALMVFFYRRTMKLYQNGFFIKFGFMILFSYLVCVSELLPTRWTDRAVN